MFTSLRSNSDAGTPTANFEGDPRLRTALEAMARNVAGEVSKRNAAPAGPKLTIS